MGAARQTTTVAVMALTVFIADLLTKTLALQALKPFVSLEMIPGFFHLSLVFNRGAAFGILPGNAALFSVLAACTVGAILFFVARARVLPKTVLWGLGMICGGAAGNLLDRLRFGYVVDFLDFSFHGWHWPAFNVADSCLCIGTGLLALASFPKRPQA